VERTGRFHGFTAEASSASEHALVATSVCDTIEVRYNLMFQHPSDRHNNQGIIRQAKEQEMGVILMRPLTSGVFQRLMADAFPEIQVLSVGRLLLNYVLSDSCMDVALVGVREPRFVELNNDISDDVASRIDLAQLRDRYVR
jgi:predicted aldo/keto reductase-like oxidoreductase